MERVIVDGCTPFNAAISATLASLVSILRMAERICASVRANVPGFDSAESAPDLKSEFQSPADPSALTKTGATLTVAPAPEYNPVG